MSPKKLLPRSLAYPVVRQSTQGVVAKRETCRALFSHREYI
jgi:hypothetical protein